MTLYNEFFLPVRLNSRNEGGRLVARRNPPKRFWDKRLAQPVDKNGGNPTRSSEKYNNEWQPYNRKGTFSPQTDQCLVGLSQYEG
jgi:hypothetical protein